MTALSYDRTGPPGDRPVLLLHAGIADRRMWDPIWPALTTDVDAIRPDLRGFGESAERPALLDPVTDLIDLLTELDVTGCDVVGVSYGAGVAVELTLSRPSLVRSLLLCAPGGSLIAEATDELREFWTAERAALAADDLDAAVEANLRWWLDGPHRAAGSVPPSARELTGQMQRRAFEIAADWADLEEFELDPPALQRLAELTVPTLILDGALDIDAIGLTAQRLAEQVPGARLISWPDVAHLPPLERPADFLALLRNWLAEQG